MDREENRTETERQQIVSNVSLEKKKINLEYNMSKEQKRKRNGHAGFYYAELLYYILTLTSSLTYRHEMFFTAYESFPGQIEL